MRLTGTLSSALLFLTVALHADAPAHGGEGARFQRFAVAADHTLASEAGASVLRAGGNAADAAAATMLALGVVSPAGSGLGGGGFALYYRKSDNSVTFLDFREQAPRKAASEMFRARAEDNAEQSAERSRVGALSVAVPGEPLGIETLQRRFGKLTLAKVVEPAVGLAGGFDVNSHVRRMLGFLGLDSSSDPLFAKVFGGPGDPKEHTKNPELAATLRTFGAQGANAFYRGGIAKQIVQKVKAAGGLMDATDLADYRVVERQPLRAQALGKSWVTAPPPSAGGYTILSSLAMLEHLGKGGHIPNGTQRLHALIESWKGPYLDRARYFGDPDHVTLPLEALSADQRRVARAERFHPVLSRPPQQYALPLPGEEPGEPVKPAEDHGTSHLCVVDAEGNIASVTTTVNLPFGAQISVGGMWLNDQMDDFAREVGKDNAFGLMGGAPNLPAAKKRPISSMSPAIVFAGDTPLLCIGGSGGSRIPTAVQQVALYTLADGLAPEAALTAPRVHHQGSPDRVELRGGDPALAQELSARGHDVTVVGSGASVQLIQITPEGLHAASDPNKGGAPRGE